MEDSTKQLAAGIASLVTGAVLINTGISVGRTVGIFGSWLRISVVYASLATGIVMVLLSVSDIDYTRWSRKTGYAAFLIVLALSSMAYFDENPRTGLNSDVTLFTYRSAELITMGENPYNSSMIGYNSSYEKPEYITLRTDGSVVDQFSYPALSALTFVPQTVLGSTNTALTTGLFMLATILFLIRQSPEYLAPLPPVFFYINDLISSDLLYNINSLWLLPYLVAMKFWYEERYPLAAVALGLSFAMKQNGWLAAPFLAIWIIRESPDIQELRSRFSQTVLYGGVAFLLPNLPFILWNPSAWLKNVYSLIYSGASAPMESMGIGLSALKTEGLIYLPKMYFTGVFISVFLVSLVIYWLYWDEIKWTAWLAPAFLLFFHHRSLNYYLTFFIPVAYYAVLLSREAVEEINMFQQILSRLKEWR